MSIVPANAGITQPASANTNAEHAPSPAAFSPVRGRGRRSKGAPRLSTRTIAYLIGAADAEDEESLRNAAESMTVDDVMELARCTANLLQHTGTTMAWLLAMAEHD